LQRARDEKVYVGAAFTAKHEPLRTLRESGMAHWLFKSEPSVYSFDRLVADKTTEWSGVRNHSAKLNMIAMKLGERGFFYHSNEGKAVVGIVEVSALYRPDPTDATGKFGMVDIRALKPLPRPVTLEEVKAEPRLAKMALVAFSRLSVQPVTDEEWRIVCEMGGLKKPA
jgi:predicted RNA-binding protein with PUA-like domain